MVINDALFEKNRDRSAPLFGNINLLGKCNANCFFCLGKDLPEYFDIQNQLNDHFSGWKNFERYLEALQSNNIERMYVTGQNCDSLQYKYLGGLIEFLQEFGFCVGLRTNGYLALKKIEEINLCNLSVGYTINSLDKATNYEIMGKSVMPNWKKILKKTKYPRVQVVINKYNSHEFFDIVRFVAKFDNVRYIQARRISTDTRKSLLFDDMLEFEKVYNYVSENFFLKGHFCDAEIYSIFGKDVCFWRTVNTTVNSFNYFTDGTISKEYFIIEGYLKSHGGKIK